MQITIHRGAKEIGGSCVEIAAATTRILIDFGMPLVTANKEPFDPKTLINKSIEELKASGTLPDIKGLYKNEEKQVDAILISHSHMDHYGLLNYVHPDIPIYMSQGAHELIKISNIFTPNKLENINSAVIKPKRPFSIGDLSIGPYLVDHSAFDALAFLISACGKRIFYSGDFRGHGRKSILFKLMLEKPPQGIDCLLMEGSMLGRGVQRYQDEESIERKITEILRSSRNIVFLFASSQNIDRLVSAYRACLRTNKIFVIDIYTAYVLDKVRTVSKNIPAFNWENIRVKFYKNQADTLAKYVSDKLLYFYNTKKIDIFELKRKQDKVLMLARDNSIFPLLIKGMGSVDGAKIIYSLWEGYLSEKFKSYCAEKKIEIEPVHTSGHATIEDLQAFACALNPKALIPIHTFERDRYQNLFKNVKIVNDGEAIEI